MAESSEEQQRLTCYYKSLYPKKNLSVVQWIEDDLHEYIDKKRMSEWLSKQRYHSAEVRKRLRHVAKIIKEFENPTIPEEESEEKSSNSSDVQGKSEETTHYSLHGGRSIADK